MSNRQIMSDTFLHKKPSITPYSLHVEDEVADKLTVYYGGDGWRSRIKTFYDSPFNISTTMERRIDDVYGIDAFGSLWRNDRRPWHLEKPVLGKASFEGFKFPDAGLFLEPLIKKNAIGEARRIMDGDPDNFHMINMGWGIFEHTWRIRGFENAMMDMVTEENFYEELVGRLTDLFVELVKYCAEVKADAIMFGDDWGDQRGVIIGPALWRKYFKPAWKRVYDEVHKQNKYVITHCCGSYVDIIPDLIEIGLDMAESVQPEAAGMNPYELKRRFGDKMCFWGGLGSQSVIPYGTPVEIKAEIKKLREIMGADGGYILSPAKPLQSEIPVENAVAVLESFIEEG